MTDRPPVALYLQDAHPIREGMEFAKYAEAKGFDAVWQADSRLVRDAVVPMAAFAAVTETIKIGSGVVDCWTRNPARLASTFSTLDDLAPGRVILRHRRVVGPTGRARSASIAPARCGRCARSSPPCAPCCTTRRSRFDGELRAPRRRRARLRLPGAPAQGRADLHRRDRDEDDGAHRRDRRRRGAELPRRRPSTTREAIEHCRSPRTAGRSSTTSTARSSSCARCTRIARPRSTWPG